MPTRPDATAPPRQRFEGMRAFWITWAGLVSSFTGAGLTRFALSVWVYQDTRDAEAFALLLFVGMLPMSLGSLVAGPLIDRWDRRRVLIVATFASRVPTAVVAVLWWQGGLELWHLYVALVVNGVATAFVLPAFDASVRLLVPREQLARASGFSQLIQTLGIVVGPPLAGALMVSVGLGSVLALDVASAILGLVALALVQIPNPARAPASAARWSVLDDFVVGLRYVLDRPAFVFLSVFLALTVFGSAFVYALSGPLVLGLGNEASIGVVYATYGLGAVVGALAVGAWGGSARRMPGILVATVAVGLGTLATGLRPDVAWIAVTTAVVGAAQSVLLALNRVVFQEHAAPEVLGRVFAFRMVLTTAAQAGGVVVSGVLAARVFEPAMAASGALAATLGPLLGTGEGRGAAVMLVAIGALLTVAALASAASRRVRTMESQLDDGR